MAVQVFKDGTSTFVEPAHLQNHLDAGWSVNDPSAPAPQGISVINQKPEGEPHVVVPPIASPAAPKKRGRKPKVKA